MKSRTVVLVIVIVGTLGAARSHLHGQVAGGLEKFPINPKPFDKFGAPVSGHISFLASEKGRQILRMSPHPVARGLLKLFGEDISGLPTAPFNINVGLLAPQEAPATTTTIGCGSTDGTRFNLEPRTGDPSAPSLDGGVFPMPQNEESVDFIQNGIAPGVDLVVGAANDFRGNFGGLGGSFTGIYVHRSGTNCSTQFEGGLPSILDANGVTLFGSGDPVVAADPARGAIFAGDLHFGFNPTTGEFDTSVGLFRSDATTLASLRSCPSGTHAFNDTACWPTGVALDAQNTSNTGLLIDKPHFAVNESRGGTAAGDVYVTNTMFNFVAGDVTIQLTTCNNRLSACSLPQTISGGDGLIVNGQFTQFSHVRVRPDGNITITYVNFTPNFGADLKFVSCVPSPSGAPKAPVCSSPVLIVNETQPIGAISQDFRVFTYPTHDHQVEPDGTTQTIIAWTRCKVRGVVFGLDCPDADVVMAASNNNGASWSNVTPVNTGDRDQFFPWVKADRATNTVNIVYYSSENDALFKHRVQVLLNQIAPGTAIPNPVGPSQVLTTLADDPSADLLIGGSSFGDYIGVTARGGRLYSHYTFNSVPGFYNGVLNPEQNNHLTRLDY